MKLSKKGEYALRSMIGLGVAAEVGRSLVQLPEIADNEQLPLKFLEQIMLRLREEKLVVGVRGKFGGYRLAKPASKITIGSVIRVIDGNFENRAELCLEHVHEGVDLDGQYTHETLKNVQAIWTRPVHLLTQMEQRKVMLSFDGKTLTEKTIG